MATSFDTTIYWPFPIDTVTEWPGTRPAPWSAHVGTDFGVPQGTPLRATISGTVSLTWDDGYGAYVLDIIRRDGLVVRNGHLSSMDVPNGSWVNAGDHIGLTGGAAGTLGAGLSTGAHLHWELRWNRAWSGAGWIDPRDLTISSFNDQPEDDMFSEEDRSRLLEIQANARKSVENTVAIKDLLREVRNLSQASYDALFTTKPTSLGTRGGVLVTLKALDDASFKTDPTSFGTPGGQLKSLAEVLELLKVIDGKLDKGAGLA